MEKPVNTTTKAPQEAPQKPKDILTTLYENATKEFREIDENIVELKNHIEHLETALQNDTGNFSLAAVKKTASTRTELQQAIETLKAAQAMREDMCERFYSEALKHIEAAKQERAATVAAKYADKKKQLSNLFIEGKALVKELEQARDAEGRTFAEEYHRLNKYVPTKHRNNFSDRVTWYSPRLLDIVDNRDMRGGMLAQSLREYEPPVNQ